jgi:hypothetical protein
MRTRLRPALLAGSATALAASAQVATICHPVCFCRIGFASLAPCTRGGEFNRSADG